MSSELGNGSNTTEGYGIGANLTCYGANGVYVDSQAQFAWFDTDLSADGLGKLADGNNGTGYALSVEVGKELAVAKGWTVTPQAQLAYASVDFDDMTDPFGAEISLRKGESLKGRVGAALGRDANWQDAEGRKARAHVYGITSLTYEFLDGATVAVSGIDLVAEPQKFGAEFGLGGTYNWADERFALHGEAVASTQLRRQLWLQGHGRLDGRVLEPNIGSGRFADRSPVTNNRCLLRPAGRRFCFFPEKCEPAPRKAPKRLSPVPPVRGHAASQLYRLHEPVTGRRAPPTAMMRC
ncbi:MAG: autotransporter outer membrane beta-barrel domain-containing protein [Candidatus Kaistia colombiensis]|nr:MAG: autotransporter outer membrane beta-barrel domain-containing protein [Kaistia sp.]